MTATITEVPMTLIDYLTRLARLWSEATGTSQARLATRVANDGKLFQRIAGGAAVTTPTFERFLLFFRDPGNWPDGRIPAQAEKTLLALASIRGCEPRSPEKSVQGGTVSREAA